MKIRKPFFVVLLFVLTLALFGCGGNNQQVKQKAEETYPNKPISVIVPSNPGGAYDSQARAISSVAQKYFGVPMVIENVPGAAFTIGAEKAAKSAPDGYTFHSASESPWIHSSLTLTVDYDPIEDVEYICNTGTNMQVMAANAKEPYNTLEEMLAYVKQHPGEVTVSYSSVMQELWLYALIDLGYEFTPVSFPSGSEAAVAVGGGHVNVNMGSLTAAKGLIANKDLKALGWGPHIDGIEPLKGVPSIKEAAPEIYDSLVFTGVGLQAPKGIPEERLQFIEDTMKKLYEDEGFQSMMKNLGFELQWKGRKEYTEEVHKQYQVAKDLVARHSTNK